MMSSITFLGTGGGRYVILSQRRYSGGIWFDLESTLLLDPGPGSLIRALQFKKDPGKLDAILVSHNHLDHYNDAELMIESMTCGLKMKRGILVTNEETQDYISNYHQSAIAEVIIPEPYEEFEINNLRVQALPTYNHANGLGFKFFTKKGTIVYASDTGYSEKIIKDYTADILILNVILPGNRKIGSHLCTEDALNVVRKVKPKLAVIQHFGMQMLNANPEIEAKRIENESGIRTIAARDGMNLDLELNNKETSEPILDKWIPD